MSSTPSPATDVAAVWSRVVSSQALAGLFGPEEELPEELLAQCEVYEVTSLDLLASVGATPAASDLWVLDSIDPATLPRDAVLDYLKAAERVAALTAALTAKARVALAGPVSSEVSVQEVHVEHELAAATRTSLYAAGVAIELARVLTTTFPSFLVALKAGQISAGHCSVLVKATRPVSDPDALAAIERVTLPKAKRLTPGAFGKEVAQAIATHDPDARGRFVRAREGRAVWTRPLEDGMSYLGLIHDTTTITAIKHRIDQAATALCEDRGGRQALADGEEDAAMGACRADALATLVLGTESDDGDGITWVPEPAQVQVQLVIDLDTLRGEADRHALLDGQPVPASIGRDLAGYAKAFRRMVTDPVDGHLLDYGQQTYLPAPLRTYVMARDGGCRAPGCGVSDPRRLELDHAIEFPDGPSDTANTGCLCRAHHQAKTAGLTDIDNSAADGSCDWITAWGQRIHIPARAFLHDSADDPPTDPDPPPVDDPPF